MRPAQTFVTSRTQGIAFRMSLVRQFVSVGGGTLGSRIFGFIRETLMAAALGAGTSADAFYAAFRFPNLFRRLFAEGAFNAAFVPLFARELEGEGPEAAQKLADEVLAVLVLVLGALTALVLIATPLIVALIAPGFVEDAGKFDLTVELFRVMFPYLICMSLTAMASGMLNALSSLHRRGGRADPAEFRADRRPRHRHLAGRRRADGRAAF